MTSHIRIFPLFTHFSSLINTLPHPYTNTHTHTHTSVSMATNSLQSLHHPLLKHHHISDTTTTQSPSSLFLKPTTSSSSSSSSLSLKHSTHFTLHSTTSFSASTTTTTTTTTPFTILEQHLSTQDYRQADEETRRLLISLAGEAAQKRGYVFFSEVQFISESDLQTIDNLWRQYSNDKFGYSIQKKIWQKSNKDFTNFFKKVGWMKKLDTEVEQYNYKAFPNEFIWELNNDTPEGHLPLTNALRGIQLLTNILNHPAFASVEVDTIDSPQAAASEKTIMSSKPLSNNNLFKTDYSF